MKYTTSILAATALAASLQADETAPLQELETTTIVTGSLWNSELQNTTASVSVISEETLQLNGTQHFADLVNSIPNLTWTGGTSRPRFFQIRGIGENSQFEGETPDSSVRFLVDDLDLTGLGGVGNLFDVQQVEVLRGPQAGAFGANAAGGVVGIVTNEPTPYWTGQIEGTAGSDSLFSGGLAVGGPILENDPQALTFRVAIQQLEQDGFRDNQTLNRDDTNKRDELTARFKLRWIANEDWQWDGTFLYADNDNGYDEFSLDNTEFDTFSDEPGRDEQETSAVSLRGAWSGHDDFTLTSITSFTNTDALYSYDSDWTIAADPRSYDGFLETNRDREVFNQELRLDSIDQEDALGWIDRWTLGAYFHNLEEDTSLHYEDIYAVGSAETTYEDETIALFGQIAHDLNEDTRIILGLRYEHHSVDVDSMTTNDYFGSLSPSSKTSQSDDLWGGKLTLEHDFNEKHMLFISTARGYKAGGANVGSFLQVGDPVNYDSETLWNNEIGLQSDWLDGAVQSRITAFYLYREDAQLRDSQGVGGFFNYLTVNGDSAEHFGLEAEGTWIISENWTANLSLGLLDADRDSYSVPSGTVNSRELANAPTYNYSASLNYQSDCGFFANVEANGSDEYFESNSHTEKRSSFTTINASVGYVYENWKLTIWAKNLFDKEYEKRVFFFGNEEPAYTPTRYEDPADPQQFGATLNYAW